MCLVEISLRQDRTLNWNRQQIERDKGGFILQQLSERKKKAQILFSVAGQYIRKLGVEYHSHTLTAITQIKVYVFAEVPNIFLFQCLYMCCSHKQEPPFDCSMSPNMYTVKQCAPKYHVFIPPIAIKFRAISFISKNIRQARPEVRSRGFAHRGIKR